MVKSVSKLRNVFVMAAMSILVAGSGAVTGMVPVASADGPFGIPEWYRGLGDNGIDENKIKDHELGEVILIIGLNIVDIVLRLLSIVAIGFIIYGGFLYLTARGEPANIAKGKATVTHAIVGLIIGIVSSAAISFLVTRIGI